MKKHVLDSEFSVYSRTIVITKKIIELTALSWSAPFQTENFVHDVRCNIKF